MNFFLRQLKIKKKFIYFLKFFLKNKKIKIFSIKTKNSKKKKTKTKNKKMPHRDRSSSSSGSFFDRDFDRRRRYRRDRFGADAYYRENRQWENFNARRMNYYDGYPPPESIYQQPIVINAVCPSAPSMYNNSCNEQLYSPPSVYQAILQQPTYRAPVVQQPRFLPWYN